MKILTDEELKNAPTDVAYLYTMAMLGQPAGAATFERAIKEHPEYFPDEVEHRRKWDSIPQEVHDAHAHEAWAIRQQCYRELPPSKGILGWIDDPKGYEEWKS